MRYNESEKIVFDTAQQMKEWIRSEVKHKQTPKLSMFAQVDTSVMAPEYRKVFGENVDEQVKISKRKKFDFKQVKEEMKIVKQKVLDDGQDYNNYPNAQLDEKMAQCVLRFGLAYKDETFSNILKTNPDLLSLHNGDITEHTF